MNHSCPFRFDARGLPWGDLSHRHARLVRRAQRLCPPTTSVTLAICRAHTHNPHMRLGTEATNHPSPGPDERIVTLRLNHARQEYAAIQPLCLARAPRVFGESANLRG